MRTKREVEDITCDICGVDVKKARTEAIHGRPLGVVTAMRYTSVYSLDICVDCMWILERYRHAENKHGEAYVRKQASLVWETLNRNDKQEKKDE